MGTAIKIGPRTGTPPTLEWIAPDRLQVDAAYQRTTDGPQSRRIIVGMLKTWDWRLCQPLIVARRADGGMFVIDGQHRLEGARGRGDIDHLPCVVIPSEAVAEEAHTFVALNNKRQRLSQGQVFAASLAAQDPDAHRVLDLVECAGLSFARSHDPSNWKPNEIFCGPAIMMALRQYGEGVVRNALVALSEAFEGQVLSRAATLLRPLYVIYAEDAKRPGFDPDVFIESLSAANQHNWLKRGQAIQQQQPSLSARDACAVAMMEAYDARRREAA
jgi:hypothetical protein